MSISSTSIATANEDLQVDRSCAQRETIDVLHVINGEHYAGAERVQDLLAENLPQFGYRVVFACIKPRLFPERRRYQDAELIGVPMHSKLDLRPAWSVARLVQRRGFRLIHCHTPRSLLIGRLAARWAGVPLVYHMHSPASRDSTRRMVNWINQQLERWAIRGAAQVITVSHSLARHASAIGSGQQQIVVVPNGVPVATPAKREAPSGQWTLGTIALFRPRKGTEVLLEAMAILRREGHAVGLRAVGPFETPRYEAALKQLAARLGVDDAVEWVGYASDVNAELAQMDVLVLPSLFGEGLPMVVLEAMAMGVPVVATDVEGVPEAVRDGVDGLICRPGNARDLAAALRRLVCGQVSWQALREEAVRRHAERFSARSMAAGVARVYDRLVRQSQR